MTVLRRFRLYLLDFHARKYSQLSGGGSRLQVSARRRFVVDDVKTARLVLGDARPLETLGLRAAQAPADDRPLEDRHPAVVQPRLQPLMFGDRQFGKAGALQLRQVRFL